MSADIYKVAALFESVAFAPTIFTLAKLIHALKMASKKPSRFIFINAQEGTAKFRSGKKLTKFKFAKSFKVEFDAINGQMKSQGGCECVVAFDSGNETSDLERIRNIPQDLHAEEALFVQNKATEIRVFSMLISLEPCRNDADDKPRYPGHLCIDLFSPKGREVKFSTGKKTCKFVPMHRNTPIFFLEAQPARGKTSTVSSKLARMQDGDAHDEIAKVGGIRIGTPLQNLSTLKWQIEGQEFLSDKTIEDILKKAKIKPGDWTGRKGDKVMDEDMDIDEEEG